jgi:hypothetical protein
MNESIYMIIVIVIHPISIDIAIQQPFSTSR